VKYLELNQVWVVVGGMGLASAASACASNDQLLGQDAGLDADGGSGADGDRTAPGDSGSEAGA
jgi:hypothetical protein